MKNKNYNGKARLNFPASKLPVKETEEELLTSNNIQWQVFRILSEFIEGFDFLRKYEKSVTIFGSARLSKHNEFYKKAQLLGKEISKLGYATVTGGGPSIMEAANNGAYENNKENPGEGGSVGLNIQLPKEQRTNAYVQESIGFRFFFTRKVMLSFAAETYIYFPGGIGTLDELFEILQLIQTHKIKEVPIILFGSKFWNNFDKFIKETLLKGFKTISEEDVNLYKITDSIEEAMEIIKNAPIRKFAGNSLILEDNQARKYKA